MANEVQVVPYKDPNQPVEARVRDLLSRMTLAEKAGQVAQIERSIASPAALTGRFIGSVLNAGGSAPRERASAEEWAEMVDEMQRWALASRLGIPIIYGTDAVHGNNNLYGATIFPHNVGLGATRDGDLARRIGEATALEVRASGIHWTFAPCVAVTDPLRCHIIIGLQGPEMGEMLRELQRGHGGRADHGLHRSWVSGITS